MNRRIYELYLGISTLVPILNKDGIVNGSAVSFSNTSLKLRCSWLIQGEA